jgi:ribosomal protein RSM22 (predicted rRNA methylase)
VVLLSHVATEISQRALTELRGLLLESSVILWVEPGTPKASQALIENRERLREKFEILSPCPHQESCGLKSHPSDWCHFFADVPPVAHQSRMWKEFSEKLGIDLRSLPVSYCCFQRKRGTEPKEEDGGRLLGRPRVYKGYLTGLVCRRSGVREERFLKREKELFHEIKKAGFSLTLPKNKQ